MPSWEAGAQRVDGGEVAAQAALDGTDQMHHVRVALHEHQPVNFHRAELAHAAHIVPAEVDQHYVLGALLFVGEHFSC